MQLLPSVFLAMPLPAVVSVTVRLTRDGEITAPRKTALLVSESLRLQAVFSTSHASTQVFAASAIAGAYILLATDPTPPRRAAASVSSATLSSRSR